MDVLAIFNGSPNGRRYGAGDVIFNVGDAAHEMYVLLEGNVDIKVDGRTIEELGPAACSARWRSSTPRPAAPTPSRAPTSSWSP